MRTDPLFNNYSLIREIPSGMRDSFLRETESLTRLTKLSIRPFNYTDYFDMRRKFFYKRSEHWQNKVKVEVLDLYESLQQSSQMNPVPTKSNCKVRNSRSSNALNGSPRNSFPLFCNSYASQTCQYYCQYPPKDLECCQRPGEHICDAKSKQIQIEEIVSCASLQTCPQTKFMGSNLNLTKGPESQSQLVPTKQELQSYQQKLLEEEYEFLKGRFDRIIMDSRLEDN